MADVYYYGGILLAVLVLVLIRAEYGLEKKQIYLVKPLCTLTVIALAFFSLSGAVGHRTAYSAGIIIGLIFSFGGDMALMFMDNNNFFRAGLVSFLLGHIAYVAVLHYYQGFGSYDIIPGIVLTVLAAAVFLYLKPGLDGMKVPVALYVLVITLMVSRAVSTRWSADFNSYQSFVIIFGAVFFYISDLILAIGRFRKPGTWHRFSLGFYYAGQYLLAVSAGMFSGVQ